MEHSALHIHILVLPNSRADEKTEKEKKRHSTSPGKGKHVSPKVMFVHHDDPKVEENLRIRGKSMFNVLVLISCVKCGWSSTSDTYIHL
jgi:hypothetical protein